MWALLIQCNIYGVPLGPANKKNAKCDGTMRNLNSAMVNLKSMMLKHDSTMVKHDSRMVKHDSTTERWLSVTVRWWSMKYDGDCPSCIVAHHLQEFFSQQLDTMIKFGIYKDGNNVLKNDCVIADLIFPGVSWSITLTYEVTKEQKRRKIIVCLFILSKFVSVLKIQVTVLTVTCYIAIFYIIHSVWFFENIFPGI